MVPMENEGVPFGHTDFFGTEPVPYEKPSRFKFGPKFVTKFWWIFKCCEDLVYRSISQFGWFYSRRSHRKKNSCKTFYSLGLKASLNFIWKKMRYRKKTIIKFYFCSFHSSQYVSNLLFYILISIIDFSV